MKKGMGSILVDVDGNSFIDYILSGGAIILGHNDEGLVSTIHELLTQKHISTVILMLWKSRQPKNNFFFPSIEKVRFTSSGSEANAAAVKIARSVTGKKS